MCIKFIFYICSNIKYKIIKMSRRKAVDLCDIIVVSLWDKEYKIVVDETTKLLLSETHSICKQNKVDELEQNKNDILFLIYYANNFGKKNYEIDDETKINNFIRLCGEIRKDGIGLIRNSGDFTNVYNYLSDKLYDLIQYEETRYINKLIIKLNTNYNSVSK